MRKNWSWNASRNCPWDCYWGRASPLFFFPFLVSVPKVFAKSHSLSFSFLNWGMEFNSQSREMLLLVATNMAAVTSSANQQYFSLNYFYIIFPF